MGDCMICDLYAVIDHHEDPRQTSDYGADLVSVLPPRAHALHDLAILQQHYQTPPSLFNPLG